MDDEYLKYFKLYHKEKNAFESGKKKFQKCKGCEKPKEFIEKENQLIYSCGQEKGNCGKQFTITLPEYIQYREKIDSFKHIIDGSLIYNEDSNDLSGYDLNRLKLYLDVDWEKQAKEIADAEKEKKEIEKDYIDKNKLKDKYDMIQELHTLNQTKVIEMQKLMKELRENTTTEEKKQSEVQYTSPRHRSKENKKGKD